jgi:choice-of-anchor B domain-containing protein
MLDLNPNPLLPTLRGTWPESDFTTANYVHDLSILDGKAYCAKIYAGGVVVLDVTAPGTPPVLGEWTWPDALTHNTWPTADGSFLATSDENTGGHLRMWDVRNLDLVEQTDEWISPNGPIVHNVYLRGNLCYMSHYMDGLRVVDVSNPYDLRAVGWYDTHPDANPWFAGAWGCYCFAADPSIVYISDMQSGTYIFRVTNQLGGLQGRARNASNQAPSPVRRCMWSVPG